MCSLLRVGVLVAVCLPIGAQARQGWDQCHSAWAPADTGVLLAEYTTHFSSRSVKRAANVRRAARSLDGTVIEAGRVVSYNALVGPRTEEAGFRLAPAIDRGKKVDRWGGGVCQPSSTLHAAALVGGLQIVERRPHTWQSKYIASGFDAVVVWGRKDLVIKNPWDFAVRIDAEVGEDYITMKLIGERPTAGWVDIRAQMVKQHEFDTDVELDPTLSVDAMQILITGIPGARVERERWVRVPGQPARRETLPTDTYYPRDALVKIGPEPRRTPTRTAPR